MPLLAVATRASASQSARYVDNDTDIMVRQISGRRFGDNEISFAVTARRDGATTRFDAEDLLETMRRLVDLGVPDQVAQGADWQMADGAEGVDPQAPTHAW